MNISPQSLPDFSIELQCLDNGCRLIGGIDEAGRGALAGPLSVALVVYPESLFTSSSLRLAGINDSKKISKNKRADVLELVKSNALWYDCVFVSPEYIDRYNINGATEYGIQELIKRALRGLDFIILDGSFRFSLPVPCLSVKKGDSKSLSVASASILAKVTRDEHVAGYEHSYPGYKFGEHMGYGTLAHRQILMDRGPAPVHRRSYEPLASMLHYPRTLFKNENS